MEYVKKFNPNDIVGQRFDKLLVSEYLGRKEGKHVYLCQCDCGDIKESKREHLRKGLSNSCGCNRKQHQEIPTGTRFDKLVVERYVGTKKYKCYIGHIYSCLCEYCGNSTLVEKRNLQNYHVKSCGCLKRLSGVDNKGWKGHKQLTGRLWLQINNHAKKRNIAVEISIEDAWLQFEKQKGLCALTNLPIYMPKNSKKETQHTASLDRIDSNKGYVPNNIQWIHKDINYMKSNFPQEKFLEYCCLIAENTHAKR